MKLLGVALIMVCSSLTGITFAGRLKSKYLISKELVLMSELISVKMSASLEETKKIIESLAKSENLSRLAFLSKIEYSSGSLSDSFKNAVVKQKMPLKDTDIELLVGLGENLGTTDYEGQKSLLSCYEEQMKKSMEGYYEDYKRLSKVYISFGVLGGMAASILLL